MDGSLLLTYKFLINCCIECVRLTRKNILHILLYILYILPEQLFYTSLKKSCILHDNMQMIIFIYVYKCLK